MTLANSREVVLKIPYWRLSGFYFFYFAFIGAIAPFWSLYLKELAFSALEIGVLMSLFAIMRMFAPNVWGALADHTGKGVHIVRLAAFACLLSFTGVFFGDGFWWMFIMMSLMSFFWAAPMPVVEAMTLGYFERDLTHYGKVRLWGSIGFIVAVLGVGYALDLITVRNLPWLVLGLMTAMVLFSLWLPTTRRAHSDRDALPLFALLRQPGVAGLLTACFLMAVAHGPYYTFYSVYLEAHDYSKKTIGMLWAVGVIFEVAVLYWMPRLSRWFSLRVILLASFIAATVRFVLIAYGVESSALLLLAQALHALTFGAYHAAAVATVHELFRGPHEARGQALYSSLSFGAGGTVGSLYSGYTWEHFGASVTYVIAAACALLGFVVLLKSQARLTVR